MAPQIIPIELSLTAGNGVTLWASRWQEDGEEWEAFLGHGDDLYVFPSAAHLAAFIRTTDEHDLADHPEWDTATALLADELAPDDDHRFDIVGVPELVSQAPDIWALAELADTVAILHSLADVCGLDVIDDVLGEADGFALLSAGPPAFMGKTGAKLWDGIGAVVVRRWDEVIEALDAIATTPEVDAAALSIAQVELDAVSSIESEPEPVEQEPDDRDPDLTFWDDIGVDPIEVGVSGRTGWTLRCYLDDEPVFLAVDGRPQVFSTPERLERYITDSAAAHQMSTLSVWPEIVSAVKNGDASVIAGPENTYQLDGLGEALVVGPGATNRRMLALAVELLTDAGTARSDSEVADSLSTATPLGNLIRAITNPDPNRLLPAPPFDDEAAAFTHLVDEFGTSLDWNGKRS